jgi:hypothetical protein
VLFTVARANRALVLVRKVVADLVARHRALVELKQERAALQQTPGSPEAREAVTARIARCIQDLNRLHQELTDVGCVLKDWSNGRVDFPADYQGRRIWLCWRLGEPAVAHWHEMHTGASGRKPIDHEFLAAATAEQTT